MAELNDNSMGMLAHLLGILTSFIGPLIIFLIIKKGKAKENAKHALNFRISVLIYFGISAILMLIFVGIFLMWAVGLFALITGIIGSVKANGGEVYTYPLEIQFIK